MKKIIITLVLSLVALVGCSNDKYVKDIDKAVKQQSDKQQQLAKEHRGDVVQQFDKKDANIYIYDKDKYIMLAYKPFKNDEEVHYYTYEVDGKHVNYKSNFNSRAYYQQHDPDYQEKNMTE